MRRKIFILILLVVAVYEFSSCSRNINFNVPSPPPLMVVEGQIQVDSVPYVILTMNSPFYGVTQLSSFGNIFVHGATVKISDGTDTVVLPEITFDTAGVLAGIYINPFTTFKGQANHTYHLMVEANGKKLTSVTSIPTGYPLDSIWVQENVVPANLSLVTLMCRFTAPSKPGYYARYFTKRNSQPFYPGINSVFSDDFVYGTTFNFPLERGVNRNDTSAYTDFGYFYRGDTITVKWCGIDSITYNFWLTLESQLQSQGPFSSPIMVQGNISGGLGIWSGYNPTYKSIIVPK